MLLQTEEVAARLMEYLGAALLVIVTTSVLSFTFSAYFSFLKWNAGFTEYYHFSQMVVSLLTLLHLNMAAEDLLHEVRRRSDSAHGVKGGREGERRRTWLVLRLKNYHSGAGGVDIYLFTAAAVCTAVPAAAVAPRGGGTAYGE